MKFRLRKPLAILSCAAASVITLSACNFGSTLLGKPQKVVPASHGELIADEFVAFTQKEETFAAKLAACTYENYDGGGNFTVSPISVYTALSLAVDKKGIEGAAGTIMPGGNGAPQPTEKYDFVIDRAFGFIITDSRDITLFSGVVNKI